MNVDVSEEPRSIYKLDIKEMLGDVRVALGSARQSNLDLSREYDESSHEQDLQCSIRVSTRSLMIGFSSLERDEHLTFTRDEHPGLFDQPQQVMGVLQEALEIFGDHPFHHVVEGRLAHVVQKYDSIGVTIPSNLMRYKSFKLAPYNDIHLNYNTPLDIPTGESHYIPPDWSRAQA